MIPKSTKEVIPVKQLYKLFARKRSVMKRVAHVEHPQWYDDKSYLEVIEKGIFSVMEPVMQMARHACDKGLSDAFFVYDELREVASRLDDNASVFYAIGLHHNGIDNDRAIENRALAFETFSHYTAIFFIAADNYLDRKTGTVKRFVDVYRLTDTKD